MSNFDVLFVKTINSTEWNCKIGPEVILQDLILSISKKKHKNRPRIMGCSGLWKSIPDSSHCALVSVEFVSQPLPPLFMVLVMKNEIRKIKNFTSELNNARYDKMLAEKNVGPKKLYKIALYKLLMPLRIQSHGIMHNNKTLILHEQVIQLK